LKSIHYRHEDVRYDWERTFDAVPDLIIILDTNFRIIKANKAMADKLGMTPDEAVGLTCYEHVHGTEEPPPFCPHSKLLENGQEHSADVNEVRLGGDYFVTVSPLHDTEGRLIGSVHVAHDITARNKAEKALRKNEKKYRDIFENVSDLIYIHNLEGYFTETNLAFMASYGYGEDDLANLNLRNIIPERHKQQFEDYLKEIIEKGQAEGLMTIVTKDGDERIVEYKNSLVYDKTGPIGVRGSARDVTEHRKLEAQLRQAQKMESIGTLAGGIAHDFNNILSAIIGYSEIALIDVERGTLLQSNLLKILQAGGRAKDLVKKILDFSRQSAQELMPVQIKPIVTEALKFLRASLPTTVEIVQNFQCDPTVMADPTQIHQILMNLCTNAGHSMQEKGGMMVVSMAEIELSSDFIAQHPELTPGLYLKISVADTGHGMDHSIQERVFEPFYTTKKRGKGTGMGLSVVHGIVKSHRGTITVYSAPGKGSTFDVYFPVIEGKEVKKTENLNALPTGNEKILFVDDEKFQVDLGKQILQRLGYKVVASTSSVEALDLFRKKPDKFDLVITDMTMPNMTGIQLSRELLGTRSDIPIIICTGFSEQIDDAKAKVLGIRGYVMKPVLISELAKKVREVLDQN